MTCEITVYFKSGMKEVKMLNMKKCLSIIMLGILVVGSFNFAGCKKEEKVIKIGAILPLTGELSFFGEGDRKALELFEKEHPDVKFVFEDSKGTAKDGLNAANKLVMEGIKYYITSLSYIVNTIQPVFDKYHCLNFTLNMDPRSEEKSPYCLRLYVTFYDEMDKLVELIEKKHLNKVAVLYVDVETMHNAVENYLRSKLKAKGIELFTESYPIGTKDFRSLLTKIAAKRPQVLRILDFGDKLGVILKQFAELELYHVIPLVVSGIETLLSNYREFPEEVTRYFQFTTPKFFLSPTNPVVIKYKEVYGEFPSYDAIFAYDIASLLVPLIRKYGYSNVDKVIQAIIEMKEFKGAAAKYSINKNGGVSPKIYWAIIRNKKIKFLE